jgi:CheY-like chemotaxis protein
MRALRVLLVEDEGLIRLLTAEALQGAGFEVVEAWNGVEAIRLLDGPDGFDCSSPTCVCRGHSTE